MVKIDSKLLSESGERFSVTAIRRVFMVDGKQFFLIGSQFSTASAYNDKESETAFKAVKLLYGNTHWNDVYWEHIAPDKMLDATFVSDFWQSKLSHQLKVDEGLFDQNGEFEVDRLRNGDVISGGIWVEPDTGVV
jgi:hypothetical protein